MEFILESYPCWWQDINVLQCRKHEFSLQDCRAMMKDGNGNTHIYHNADLLRHNLFGQPVNSSLLHRGPAFMVAAFGRSQQAGEMFVVKFFQNWLRWFLWRTYRDKQLQMYTFQVTENVFLALCFSQIFSGASTGWKPWTALAKSAGLFFSALLPGSSRIANSYLSPQARLNVLTVGLWLEFRLGFHVQLTGSNNCRHMRAKSERKLWKRYILEKLPSKHRETVVNTPKEGKKRRVSAHLFQPHYRVSVSYMLMHGDEISWGFKFH